MERNCKTIIIIPTLNPIGAATVAEEARKTAGVKCGILIASDQEKRGAVIVGNVLLKAAMEWGARYVCYLNDDTAEFEDDWLKRLIRVLESNDQLADVSASGNCRGGPQRDPGTEGVIVTKHPLAWFCTVIRAKALEEVGLFDEGLIHYADDSDLSFRMTDAGWLHACTKEVWVDHDPCKPIEPWWSQDLARLRAKHPGKFR